MQVPTDLENAMLAARLGVVCLQGAPQLRTFQHEKIILTLRCSLLVSGMITNAKAADKLHHVVCFKFKSTVTPEDIKKVEQAFQALQQKIPQIVALEWGTNISKEHRDKGFTHCFIVSFKSEKDCDAYL
jgi:hypothetical protein